MIELNNKQLRSYNELIRLSGIKGNKMYGVPYSVWENNIVNQVITINNCVAISIDDARDIIDYLYGIGLVRISVNDRDMTTYKISTPEEIIHRRLS
jgi:hypothetical protein